MRNEANAVRYLKANAAYQAAISAWSKSPSNKALQVAKMLAQQSHDAALANLRNVVKF